MPEQRLGQEFESVTGTWGGVDDLFARAQMVLRDGNGVRSGSFELPWTHAEWRFWNQMSDTKPDDWSRSTASVMDRRFDAAFNFQQLHRDVRRAEVTYKSKQDFKRLKWCSGLFGFVGVSAQTEQGGQNISRFRTGTNLRVCTSDVSFRGAPEKGPGGVLAEACWKSRGGEHGSFRMRYDKQEGKRHGKLTVRMVWHEITHRDVEGFEDKCLIAQAHKQKVDKKRMTPPPPPTHVFGWVRVKWAEPPVHVRTEKRPERRRGGTHTHTGKGHRTKGGETGADKRRGNETESGGLPSIPPVDARDKWYKAGGDWSAAVHPEVGCPPRGVGHRVPAPLPYFLSQRHVVTVNFFVSAPALVSISLFFLLVYLYFEMRFQHYWLLLLTGPYY
jgi:hypothetical protein